MTVVRLTPELIAERAARVRAVMARAEVSELVRPARDPEKRATLEEMGGLGPFRESKFPRPTQLPARRG